MVSRLTLQRQGRRLSSGYQVIARDIAYTSPIRLTPYRQADRLDGSRLAAHFARAYQDAGIDPKTVDTGVVIATGEAAKKPNAPVVARAAAAGMGRFVSVAAGPSLEGTLAAHGAGTVERSRQEGSTLLNVDLGGGGCKVALVRRGRVVDTSAISVGARLVAFDRAGRINRIEQPGRAVAGALGIRLALGRRLALASREAMADRLASLVTELLSGQPQDALGRNLLLTAPPSWTGHIDGLCFSGGVAEYFYGRETKDFGDLGAPLAGALRRRVGALGVPVVEPRERIRATVIGLSQYTVRLSGSTIYTSDERILPLRDLPVVVIDLAEQPLEAQRVRATILRALRRHDLAGDARRALALSGDIEPGYVSLRRLAQGIVEAAHEMGWEREPLVLIFNRDIGGLVGNLLVNEVGYRGPVISIDEIDVQDFDYLDIGRRLPEGEAVPVVIKSLVFHPARVPTRTGAAV